MPPSPAAPTTRSPRLITCKVQRETTTSPKYPLEQRETPISSDYLQNAKRNPNITRGWPLACSTKQSIIPPGNIPPPKLPPTAEQSWKVLPRLRAWGGRAPPLTNLCLPSPALQGLVVADSGEGHLGGVAGECHHPKARQEELTAVGRTRWLTMVYSGTMVEGMRAWRRLSTCFRKMNQVEFTCSRICKRAAVTPVQRVLAELPSALPPLPVPVPEVMQGSVPPQPQ